MAAAAAPVLGGIFGAGGAQMEASDKAYAMEDEAAAADRNAANAKIAGQYNAEKLRMYSDKVEGGTRSDFAASGVAGTSASALEVLRESHMSSELDRQNILYGADVRASNYQARASSLRTGARNERQMGTFNAFSALFGGGAKAAAYMPGGGSGGGGGGDASGGGYGTAGGGGSYANYA